MENKKLKTLALMGLAGGLLCAGEANAAGNRTYNTQASSGCGGFAVGNNCGAENAPAGQTVSVGCAAKQIGFGNNQDANFAAGQEANYPSNYSDRQEAGYQGNYSNPRDDAAQQPYYNRQPGAQQPQHLQQGQQPLQGQSISQGCGASPKSSQNNNHYYADAIKDEQNEADRYQDSNSYKKLADNEVRPGARLVDPRLTDKDFHNDLTPQAKATFQSLPPEGKALAIKLANEDPAHDKNAAVKKAAERMAEKRNGVLNKSMSH